MNSYRIGISTRVIFTHEANDIIMIDAYNTALTIRLDRHSTVLRALITKREKEILGYMATGHTSAEIATSLFISDHTVISHRKNLMIKLGARNSAHLVMKGVQLGLLQ